VPPQEQPTNYDLDRRLEDLQKTVEEVRYEIVGNGKPGLKTDVDRLMTWRETEQKRQATLSKYIGWVLAPLIAFGVVSMVGTAIYVVKAVNRIESVQQQDMQKP
jgi:hypothetical protein